MALSNKISVGAGRSINGLVGGSFVLDGANNPSVVGGDIVSVTRELKGGGANVFFRVVFRESVSLLAAASSITATPFLPDALFATTATANVGAFVADSSGLLPSDARHEIDVQVRDAAGALIDTAGIRINLDGLVQV